MFLPLAAGDPTDLDFLNIFSKGFGGGNSGQSKSRAGGAHSSLAGINVGAGQLGTLRTFSTFCYKMGSSLIVEGHQLKNTKALALVFLSL